MIADVRPTRLLPPGVVLGRSALDHDHWVTYFEDGTIERKIYEKGAKDPLSTSIESVRAYEPIFRPRLSDKEHIVTNIGGTPISFHKQRTPPKAMMQIADSPRVAA
jgi:hypothetical protein